MTQCIRTSNVAGRISTVLILTAVWLITAAVVQVHAETGKAQTGRITGRVIAQDTGEPLVNANVEVTGPDLTTKMGAISDAEGRYTIDLPPGSYTVKAAFVGYRKGTVRNIVVSAGESVEVPFRMETVLYEIDEIVVSASRRAENIIDAPISIAKVDAKEIQRNAAIGSYKSAIKNLKGVDRFQTGIFS